MRLRENQYFLKLTTRSDLLHEGSYLEHLERIESFLGRSLPWFEDLGARRRPRRRHHADVGGLSSFCGQGLQQAARFRVSEDESMRGARLEINATAHPYTGAHVSHMEIRWPHQDVHGAARDGRVDRTEELVSLVRTLIEDTSPLCAHVHDVDDHAVQNSEGSMIMRVGYGVDEARLADVPLEKRAGREWSRGEFRLCACWLTFVSDELHRILEDYGDAEATEDAEPLAGGWIFRLSEAPMRLDAADVLRSRQHDLRAALGLAEAAGRLRRNFGYWQRRE